MRQQHIVVATTAAADIAKKALGGSVQHSNVGTGSGDERQNGGVAFGPILVGWCLNGNAEIAHRQRPDLGNSGVAVDQGIQNWAKDVLNTFGGHVADLEENEVNCPGL